MVLYGNSGIRGRQGSQPIQVWFKALDVIAAAKDQRFLTRLELGNTSNVKGVGGGVFELRVDFGPGYRVYFGKDGSEIVILLGGERRSDKIATSMPRRRIGEATRSARRQV